MQTLLSFRGTRNTLPFSIVWAGFLPRLVVDRRPLTRDADLARAAILAGWDGCGARDYGRRGGGCDCSFGEVGACRSLNAAVAFAIGTARGEAR